MFLDETTFAVKFATEAHKGQYRDFSGDDYITHPIRVAESLVELDYPEYVVIAAILHDVVEDCDVTIQEIDDIFGREVANIVNYLTDPSIGVHTGKKSNRLERLTMYKLHIDVSGLIDVYDVKLADIIDNTFDMIKYYDRDLKRAERFIENKSSMLEVLTRGNSTLYIRAEHSLSTLNMFVSHEKEKRGG